jgi:hypothetical protein
MTIEIECGGCGAVYGVTRAELLAGPDACRPCAECRSPPMPDAQPAATRGLAGGEPHDGTRTPPRTGRAARDLAATNRRRRSSVGPIRGRAARRRGAMNITTRHGERTTT